VTTFIQDDKCDFLQPNVHYYLICVILLGVNDRNVFSTLLSKKLPTSRCVYPFL